MRVHRPGAAMRLECLLQGVVVTEGRLDNPQALRAAPWLRGNTAHDEPEAETDHRR